MKCDFHNIDQFPLQKYHSGGNEGQTQQHGPAVDALFQILKRNDQRAGAVGGGDQLQRDLRADAQNAFGADDQILQIHTSGVFHHVGGEVHDLAVGHDRLDTADIVTGDTVAHGAHTTGVRDDGAANGCSFFAGIGRIEQTGLCGSGSHLGNEGAGLSRDGHVLSVHREDLVHLHQGQHNAAIFAVGAACKAGAGTAGNHGDVVLVGVLHDGGDFFFIQDLHIQFRREHAVFRHLVVIVLTSDGLANPDALGIGNRADVRKVGLVHFLIGIGHITRPPLLL